MIIPFSADASRKIVPIIMGGMVFLAVLSLALALSLMRLSHDWQRDLVGGATVQIPAPSDLPREQIERQVAAVLDLLKNTKGVIQATPVSEVQTRSLLAPWFGNNDTLFSGTKNTVPKRQGGKKHSEDAYDLGDGDWLDLPIPRLVDVTIDPDQFQIEKFRQTLASKVPGASFDDHLSWLSGMVSMASSLQIIAFLVVILVGVVAILTVAYATTSGMEIHRDVIDVLHMIGARDEFIAKNFVRFQAKLALKGALGGEILALLLILLIGLLKDHIFPGIGLDFGPTFGGFFLLLLIMPLMVGLSSLTAWRLSMKLLRRLS